MWSNPQEIANLVTFIEEIANGYLHFLRCVAEKFYKGFQEKSVPKIALWQSQFTWAVLANWPSHTIFIASQKLINTETAPQHILDTVSSNVIIG